MIKMYNSMSALPKALYRILEYLVTAESAEDIWKMLKYNDYYALSNPNLTMTEKLDLLWREGKQEDYSVFFTNLIEDAMCVSKCVLKMYHYYTYARPSSYLATPTFAFDFLYGGQMSLVEKDGIPVNRGDLFINCLLASLNGANIGGVGTLIFDDEQSRYDAARSVVGNSKTFTGVQIYLSTLMGDTGAEVGCGS